MTTLKQKSWLHGIIRENIDGIRLVIPRCDEYPYQTKEYAVWLKDVIEWLQQPKTKEEFLEELNQ